MKRVNLESGKEDKKAGNITQYILWFSTAILYVFTTIQIITFNYSVTVNAQGDFVGHSSGFGILSLFSNNFYLLTYLGLSISLTIFLCYLSLSIKFDTGYGKLIGFIIVLWFFFLPSFGTFVLNFNDYLGNGKDKEKIEVFFSQSGIDDKNVNYEEVESNDVIVLGNSLDENLAKSVDKDKSYYIYQVRDDKGDLSVYYSETKLDNVKDIKLISEIDKDDEIKVVTYFNSLDK